MNELKDKLGKQRYSTFVGRKTRYCQNVSSSPLDLEIQCDSSQPPSMLLYGYQRRDSEVYMQRQKAQNGHAELEADAP